MKFLSIYYTLIIFSTEIFCVPLVSEGNLEEAEIAYIVDELNPTECLELVEKIFLKKPFSSPEYRQSEGQRYPTVESIRRRNFDESFPNRDACYEKLKRWTLNLPQKKGRWARMALEVELGALGRSDLAKFLKKDQRIARYAEKKSKIVREDSPKPSTESSPREKYSYFGETDGLFENSGDGQMTQHYSNFAEGKSSSDHAMAVREETLASYTGVQQTRSNNSDMLTRWTAFLTLIAVIIITILSTVVFALYKKNRGNLFSDLPDCAIDRCLMAERQNRRPSRGEADVERGDDTDSGPRRSHRDSLLRKSFSRVRPCHERFFSERKQQRPKKSAKPRKSEKREKTGCSSTCKGLEQVSPKPEKSDKNNVEENEPKVEEIENRETVPRGRIDLKKFHEKIASILRRDDQTCQCCKCTYSVDERSNKIKCVRPGDFNVCADEKCQKNKLKNIAELCLSPEEDAPDERQEIGKKSNENGKKKKKKARPVKAEKKKQKNFVKSGEKKKESRKNSPEKSAISKEGKESKARKKIGKAKKEILEEFCTRKTCDCGKSRHEAMSD